MCNIYLYGDVLYGTMNYLKGKCSGKPNLEKEIIAYLNLWSICLNLLQDEILNGTDNFNILKTYLQKYSYKNAIISDDDGIYSIAAPPLEAIGMIIKIIAEINIEMVNYKRNLKKINNYLFALHNLPRCLLSPQNGMYINQKTAIEYSLSYLHVSTAEK